MAKDRVNNEKIIVITRRLDAPRQLVFNAFTDPEHLVRWWGPKGFKMAWCKLDLRPGGMIHYCARSSEGKLLWGRIEFRETQGQQRIIFMQSISDDDGEKLSKVVLTETNGQTIVKVTDTKENENEILDQLENYLFTITEKTIHHEYK
jgi:uncharacterized protein YndB with AHSA1/START domain